MKKKIPYFLWDYNLSEKEVRKMLKNGDDFSRRWLIARILTSAHFKDVFKYLTLKEVLSIFPRLKMKKETRKAWEKAFSAWGYDVEDQKQSYLNQLSN